MAEITITSLALSAYLAPFSLLLVALAVSLKAIRSVDFVFQVGRAVATVSFIFFLVAGVIVFTSRPLVSPIIGFANVGITLRLDAISIVMCWLVTFLGVLLIQFSRNYLAGDPHQAVFLSRLYLTIGAVLLLVLSGNLWQLVLAWIGTSIALHQLLLFYPNRPRAVIAARKKFFVARIGDICLIVAALLIVRAFGTTDLGAIQKAAIVALASKTIPDGIGIASALVVFAAALKSAIFPFHGWLLEVMETPTPVSALLHAGLLNAGIFLVVRLSDVVFLSTPAVILLIVLGGFTAIFASFAMITQNSIKVSLAYSSAAHMGFMLMLCGFGAGSVAIMHLIAHSCYKAHAFLSSGSAVDYAQNTGSQKLNKAPHPLLLLVSLLASAVIFVVVSMVVGVEIVGHFGETALGIIFVMAVSYLLVKGTTGMPQRYVIGRSILMVLLVTLAFTALELVSSVLMRNTIASFPTPDTLTLAVMVLAVVAFGAALIFSTLLPILMHHPAGRALYVHVKNGFYANALFDRLINPSR